MTRDPLVTDSALRAIEGLARDLALRPLGARDMAMARLVTVIQPLTLASIVAELRKRRSVAPRSGKHRGSMRPAPADPTKSGRSGSADQTGSTDVLDVPGEDRGGA